MSNETLYRVVFMQGEEECYLHALHVIEDSLAGFIELDELVFQSNQTGVTFSQDEKMSQQFKGVRGTYLPVNKVIRIDVLELVKPLRCALSIKAQNKITSINVKLLCLYKQLVL